MAELRVLTVDGLKYAVDKIQDRMDYLTCDIASCNTSLSSSLTNLTCRVNVLENALDDIIATLRELQDYIRPASVAETEKPKQKSDLEIFTPIVWDEDFLKLNENMFLIDLQ